MRAHPAMRARLAHPGTKPLTAPASAPPPAVTRRWPTGPPLPSRHAGLRARLEGRSGRSRGAVRATSESESAPSSSNSGDAAMAEVESPNVEEPKQLSRAEGALAAALEYKRKSAASAPAAAAAAIATVPVPGGDDDDYDYKKDEERETEKPKETSRAENALAAALAYKQKSAAKKDAEGTSVTPATAPVASQGETAAEGATGEVEDRSRAENALAAALEYKRKSMANKGSGAEAGTSTDPTTTPAAEGNIIPGTTKRGTTVEEWKQATANEPSDKRMEEALTAALEYTRKQNKDAKKGDEKGQSGGLADYKKMKSMEQLTKKLNEEARKDIVTEVEIISKDKDYRPTVSTWGVFPRPDNISKAYGGGRTIKPGGELESEEEKEERTAKLKASIAKYKQEAGLVVDDETTKLCKADFSDAEALMAAGNLEQARRKFKVVADKMPAKSRLGGEAQLQAALCLDSMGKMDEAKEEYELIVRHPATDVAKRARMMLDGFKSMEFLKADQFDFMTQRSAYGDYFESMSQLDKEGSWNSGYVYTPQEGDNDGLDPKLVGGVVVALFAFPLLLVVGLMLAK